MRIAFLTQSEYSINIYCKLISFSFVCFNSSEKLLLCILDPPVSTFCFVCICHSWTCLHYQFENPLHLSPMVNLPVPVSLLSFLFFSLFFHEHFLLLSLFFLFDDSFLRKNAKLLRFYMSKIVFHLAVGLTDSMTRYRTLD